MSILTGAEILIESLLKEEVEIIFGYPGGSTIKIYDVIYDSVIKHYLTRHEQGAIHAADGYARSTGKVGVCITTSGPGATNLVTGLTNAYMDSVPIVAFTGQVATTLIGKDAFQEADIRGITMPITKHNYLVTDVTELAQTIKNAFYIARTGRPGPVLIDIPKDVTIAETDFYYPDDIDLPGYKPVYEGHKLQIAKAANTINNAKRPILYVGGGVIISNASLEIQKFADKAKIPVTTTLMGIGTYPENKPLALEMLGMHGTRYANFAIGEADLIIAVGARFDDRVTGELDLYAPKAKIIHIDIDPAEIGKNVNVDIPIVGDVKKVLKELIPHIHEKESGDWQQRILELKRNYPLEYHDDEESDVIKPQYLLEELCSLTAGNAIITTEVGQNQMWAAQFYKYSSPRSFISSGGLGTMGFGLPASIGVQLGNPEQSVFLIAGDGSFQMNIQELATISNYKIPIKMIILNNSSLGMVRQWQELFFNKRYSATNIKNPDFIKIAEAYGIPGKKVTKRNELSEILKNLIEYKGAYLLDVYIPTEEKVYPMVPPGAGLNDMIGG